MWIALILLISYMVLLLERNATVNVGGERGAFCSIDLCKEKKLYAPFKYRPLGFWLARLFSVTSKNIKPMMVWAERYFYNIYLLDSTGVEKYYVFKYCLLVLANFSFYWYMTVVGLPPLLGVFILDLFICLTFIYDSFDYLIEIALYALFCGLCMIGGSVYLLLLIAMIGALNRETSIFMIPIAYCYEGLAASLFAFAGFIVGFVIPRIIYRKAADNYDAGYKSGFWFLTFDPIRNWKHSIWPPLKNRFQGMMSNFFFTHNGQSLYPNIGGNEIQVYTKEFFLNRIFLGIVAIVFYLTVLTYGFFEVSSILRPLSLIFILFTILVSIPSDIREIRVYAPVYIAIVPYLWYLV